MRLSEWVLVLIKMGNLSTETDKHMGRAPCEDEGIDQGDESTSQGMSNIARKPPEDRTEAKNSFLLESSEENNPTNI